MSASEILGIEADNGNSHDHLEEAHGNAEDAACRHVGLQRGAHGGLVPPYGATAQEVECHEEELEHIKMESKARVVAIVCLRRDGLIRLACLRLW